MKRKRERKGEREREREREREKVGGGVRIVFYISDHQSIILCMKINLIPNLMHKFETV